MQHRSATSATSVRPPPAASDIRPANHRTGRKRRGAAMLDVVTASIMTAVVLVPSMNIMRRSLAVSSTNEMRQEISTLAGSTLERQIAATAVDFRRQSYTGSQTVSDQLLRYRVTASDQPDYGGIAGQLMGIAVTVWHDKNRNRRTDRGEPAVTLYSKVAAR